MAERTDEGTGFTVRRSRAGDLDGFLDVRRRVAEEDKWIATEAPLDVERDTRSFLDSLEDDDRASFVGVDGDGIVIAGAGVGLAPYGVAEFGMMVDVDWRGRGIGSALLREIVEWSRGRGAHKVALQAWPHNDAAIALYTKFGFVTEGTFRRHYRRRNGELWDAVCMGLVLDEESPGSPH